MITSYNGQDLTQAYDQVASSASTPGMSLGRMLRNKIGKFGEAYTPGEPIPLLQQASVDRTEQIKDAVRSMVGL